MTVNWGEALRGNRAKGFTLLELMIVVVVIAILAALAYFNFSRYGLRARRTDGKDMITTIAAAEERYYTNYNQYTTTLSNLGFSSGTSVKGYYTVAAANGSSGDTQTYLLTATPVAGGPQANDQCGSLTLDNTGAQAPAPGVMPQNSNGNCW